VSGAGREWLRDAEPTWCPGCGNYRLLQSVAGALSELRVEPWKVVVVSGIGQAGKLPHYLRVNFLHGLHGRTLAKALGIRLANPGMTVLAVGGDGDLYGEGGNHLIHAFRRNPNVCCLVHNNGVYGLTRGQGSPTAQQGFRDGLHPAGNALPAFNPLAVGLACGATFLARGFVGNPGQLSSLIVQAVRHPGFGFIDVLQPCVTYNRHNTYGWFSERVYEVGEDSHDTSDRDAAFRRALEWPGKPDGPILTGVLYRSSRVTYEERVPALSKGPLTDYVVDRARVERAAEEFL
jgi:2-oxoglutarate ferredoxin oxidoreductase subunit beta